MELQFLDTDDVRRIYDALVEDFTQSSDPIEPAGVRDDHLLEPAVSRQYVSSERYSSTRLLRSMPLL
jgi:hypothetical protein